MVTNNIILIPLSFNLLGITEFSFRSNNFSFRVAVRGKNISYKNKIIKDKSLQNPMNLLHLLFSFHKGMLTSSLTPILMKIFLAKNLSPRCYFDSKIAQRKIYNPYQAIAHTKVLCLFHQTKKGTTLKSAVV